MICECCGETPEEAALIVTMVTLSKRYPQPLSDCFPDGVENKALCWECAGELGVASVLGLYNQSIS